MLLTNILTTGAVISGRREICLPPLSSNAYSSFRTLGPDLRMKSSASSNMGVSTSLNPNVLAVCLSLFS